MGIGKETENYFIPEILILEATNVMRPPILTVSKQLQWLIWGIRWFLILIGSYFRYIMYQYIFCQWKSKALKPIDIATLLVSMSQHLSVVLYAIAATMTIITDTRLDDIGGHWFCLIARVFIKFDLFYSVFGSLGISIYRIACIRANHLVKNHIGKKRFFCGILLGGLSISCFIVVLLESDDYAQLSRNTCMHLPNQLIILLDQYEQSRGIPSIYPYWRNVRVIVGFTGALMTTVELGLYISFFRFVYKNDNKEVLRHLLGPNVIRLRNRTNAITFFGQFCSFVFEFSMMILLLLAASVMKDSFYSLAIIMFLKSGAFTAMAIVEVLTSPTLRTRLLNRLKQLKTN